LKCEVYDTNTDKWTILPEETDLTVQNQGPTACSVLKRYIYLFGGDTAKKTNHMEDDKILIFRLDTWNMTKGWTTITLNSLYLEDIDKNLMDLIPNSTELGPRS
jgi:hypothetical protein